MLTKYKISDNSVLEAVKNTESSTGCFGNDYILVANRNGSFTHLASDIQPVYKKVLRF